MTLEVDISNRSKYILADDDLYKIVFYKSYGLTKKLVITFDAHGHGIRDFGFGTGASLKAGFDNVFISHKLDSQYQGLSLELFKAILGTVIILEGYDEVYTYGASLGGYCAIYYAGCINAKAIAISPLNSAHPSISSKRFSELVFSHSDIKDNPKSSYDPIVIYDPLQKVDKDFIELNIISAYPKLNLVELPYAGHLVAEALLETGQLNSLFLSLINQAKVPLIDLGEHNSSYWNYEKYKFYMSVPDFRVAFHHLLKSLEIRYEPDKFDELISLGKKVDGIGKIPFHLFAHYINLLEESKLFDRDWYVLKYNDVAMNAEFSLRPEFHYLVYGGYEGRCAGRNFDSKFYLENNSDVKESGLNPLIHYLKYGIYEQRTIQDCSCCIF